MCRVKTNIPTSQTVEDRLLIDHPANGVTNEQIALQNTYPYHRHKQLYINYQLDAQIIIYSYNITFLYMFRAINAHL